MDTFGEVAEHLRRATVQVLSEGPQRGGGSGIIWRTDGLILTNAHVARSLRPVVELWDGRRLDARVAVADPRRDLAALRVPADGLPAATAGDSDRLRPGELVIAVGNPLGFRGALATGVIHSVGRMPGMGSQPWVRATVRLAPGNSGGPLANANGEVIGVNTAIVHGLGLAVPSGAVREFLRRGARPRLGVVLRPVAYDGARLGMLILDVEAGSAADTASLRIGDILIGIRGSPLESMDALSDALDSADGAVPLQFLRGDRRRVREAVARIKMRAEAA